MKIRLYRRFLGLAFAISALPLAAATGTGEIVLQGPEVVKLDWGTRALQVADLNGDGLNDIAVINNDRGTIDLLYQLKPGQPLANPPRSLNTNRWEPVVEDARFRKSNVTTGVSMFDLALGDLDGDGRMDLVYSGSPQALTIRYQQADGSWLEKKITEAPAPNQMVGSLKVADLNGDGRTDIAMLGLKELAVFLQDKDGGLDAPERYPLPDDNCYGLEICDVNGDGLLDLVYLCNGPRQTVRVRLQTPTHQFGPELSFEIKNSRCTLQILRDQNPDAKDGAPVKTLTFAFAQDGTGQLEEFRLKQEKPDADAPPALRARVYSPRPGSKTPLSYAFGDFTGDKRRDVVVGDPEGAQVFVYLREADGGFSNAQKSPVFSDARCLAAGDWDGDGHDEIFVGSAKEQAVGVARYVDGRFEYPRPLPITGKPLGIAFADMTGKGKNMLAVLREEKGKRYIELWTRKGDSAECAKSIEITGLKTDPKGLRLVDANQDGKMDIAVFTPLDSMRLYVQGENLNFTEASSSAGFRKGLVDNLEAAALTQGDVDGDGKDEMVISSGAFARALKLKDGELTVLDQFNARDPNAEVAATFVLPATDAKSKKYVVLYDRKGEQFQILGADDKGVYQQVSTEPAGKIDVSGAEVFTDKANRTEAFIFGKDRFWWFPIGREEFRAETVSTHTTDLPDVSYADIIAADLNNDGRAELVCVDPTKNLLEILTRDSTNQWRSMMHFKVFETDQHYQGRRGSPFEPRETVLADVTGTGKKSVILLVHNRVLIYPQE